MKDWNWKNLGLLTFAVLLLSAIYCYVLYQLNVIPLGGKKAPTFVFLLVAQWFLVYRYSKDHSQEKYHFLKLFAYQYALIVLVGGLGAYGWHLFYESFTGKEVLQQFVIQSIAEIQKYSPQIESREGKEYLIQLVQGVQGITAGSIAKDEFVQKIALGFLPNLLISLYYKRL